MNNFIFYIKFQFFSVENQSKILARYKQTKPIIEKGFRNSEHDKEIKTLQMKIVQNVNADINEHSTPSIEENDAQTEALKAALIDAKNELVKLKAEHANEIEMIMAEKFKDAKKIESLELQLKSFKEQHVAEVEVHIAKTLDYAKRVKSLEFELKNSKELHIAEVGKMEEQKRIDGSKFNAIEMRLKDFEDEYRGEINSGHVFQRSDKDLFCEFIDYANAYLSIPISANLRAKVVKKLVTKVEKYKANSQDLLSRCMFYLFSFELVKLAY